MATFASCFSSSKKKTHGRIFPCIYINRINFVQFHILLCKVKLPGGPPKITGSNITHTWQNSQRLLHGNHFATQATQQFSLGKNLLNRCFYHQKIWNSGNLYLFTELWQNLHCIALYRILPSGNHVYTVWLKNQGGPVTLRAE